ncbi:MAG: Uma2 family endonuclease [Planctomycetes bacterium]|nr:Uma2 family endonuclease [Planctomycetota bacterium]
MGLPKAKPKVTIDEYLVSERASADRHIYIDGEVFAMAGESGEHGDISSNALVSIGSQLRGKECRARTKDTKVLSGPILSSGQTTRGFFSYPDIVVICGEPEYHDLEKDVVLNRTAIIEVLSPSTEAFDRGEKFTRYQQWNSTLRDYLLVLQNQPQIEHYSRKADGTWLYKRHAGVDAIVKIDSIGCVLKLADVYERIEFPPEPTD